MKRISQLFIATCLATVFASLPAHASQTPAATDTGGSLPITAAPKPIKPLKPAVFAEISPLAPVLPPQPTPSTPPPANAAPSGCIDGWFSGDYYLDNIIRYESGGRTCATNPGGCFGLLQACPGEPLKLACGGNPTCQIAWFQQNKTGGRSWAQVWQHELDYGWW